MLLVRRASCMGGRPAACGRPRSAASRVGPFGRPALFPAGASTVGRAPPLPPAARWLSSGVSKSGTSRADLVRYGTWAAGGVGVYVVSSGVMSTVSGILHVNPATMAKYGFVSGFVTAGAVFGAATMLYGAIHIRPQPAYRAALASVERQPVVSCPHRAWNSPKIDPVVPR